MLPLLTLNIKNGQVISVSYSEVSLHVGKPSEDPDPYDGNEVKHDTETEPV